jgi:hypothetical protein
VRTQTNLVADLIYKWWVYTSIRFTSAQSHSRQARQRPLSKGEFDEWCENKLREGKGRGKGKGMWVLVGTFFPCSLVFTKLHLHNIIGVALSKAMMKRLWKLDLFLFSYSEMHVC